MGVKEVIILLVLIFIGLGLIISFFLFFTMMPWGTWVNCFFQGIPISAFDLLGMGFRNVNADQVVGAMIRVNHSKIPVKVEDLEAHILSAGDLNKVIDALITAKQANIPLNFNQACAIDLAGRDVAEAVHLCVNPQVINIGAFGIARDGIQVQAKVKLTLKANIEKLVGSMTENTIHARVVEGVISTIGHTSTHREVLKQPSILSQALLAKGLAAGTAFTIVSIDIADLDVGENIGARLRDIQATADKQMGQAKAEGLRAMALAQEFEANAEREEMNAKLVENESLVPRALESAWKTGKFVVPRKHQTGQQLQLL